MGACWGLIRFEAQPGVQRIHLSTSQKALRCGPACGEQEGGRNTSFCNSHGKGDPVLAASGTRVLGLGRIADRYEFDPKVHKDAPHHRSVDWDSSDEFTLPTTKDGLRTTVYSLKSWDNRIEVERRLLASSSRSSQRKRSPVQIKRLDGILVACSPLWSGKGRSFCMVRPGREKHSGRVEPPRLAALGCFGKRFRATGRELQGQYRG